VAWRLASGVALFTGYLTEAAEREYLGWDQAGAVYRYAVVATGDEALLDRAPNEVRPPIVQKSAGAVLRELAPAGTDVSAVEDCGTIAELDPSLRKWSDCAAEAATLARAAYSAIDGRIVLRPIGERAFTLSERDANFSPQGLKLQSPDKLLNAITVLGGNEPDAYVKDYFEGDGARLTFDMSQAAFSNQTTTVFEQEYTSPLDLAWWTVTDPSSAIAIASGSLFAVGGVASVQYAEQIELAGALQFQHGDVTFQAASDGVIGGLYNGATCIAGFHIAKSGAQSTISALVNGSVTGTPITTQINHRYLMTTRVYATEAVRRSAWLRSSTETLGGADRTADLRVVLEVHDVDLDDVTTLMAAATVLYDDVIPNAPAFCAYTLLNANDLHCSLAYTRLLELPWVTVRSALPGEPFRTRLVGAMIDGGECSISGRTLKFYNEEAPASGEQIVAEYRDARKMGATVAVTGGSVRSAVVELTMPLTRMSDDCTNAARALLDDTTQIAWIGTYVAWRDFLPDDIWPGDVLHVNAPSRGCVADVVVREVQVESLDPANERSWYAISFANEAASPIAIASKAVTPLLAEKTVVLDPAVFALDGLQQAAVTNVTSTQVTMGMGADPIAGGGFEVRYDDSGWNPSIDRNLIGRFNTRVITVTRLAKVVSFFVRQYDSSNRYSRWASLLHVDMPL
jgi:hypothetical protein